MYREKHQEIKHLEEKLRAHIDNSWGVKQYEIPEQNEDTVTDLEDRIARVSATKEYLAIFSIWSQLLISILLPKALQLLIS